MYAILPSVCGDKVLPFFLFEIVGTSQVKDRRYVNVVIVSIVSFLFFRIDGVHTVLDDLVVVVVLTVLF